MLGSGLKIGHVLLGRGLVDDFDFLALVVVVGVGGSGSEEGQEQFFVHGIHGK